MVLNTAKTLKKLAKTLKHFVSILQKPFSQRSIRLSVGLSHKGIHIGGTISGKKKRKSKARVRMRMYAYTYAYVRVRTRTNAYY